MPGSLESGGRPPQLAISLELHTRLYRCTTCLSYWEENERYADGAEMAVQSDYPDVIIVVDRPPH